MTPEQFDKLPLYAQRVIEQQGEEVATLRRIQGSVDQDSAHGVVRTYDDMGKQGIFSLKQGDYVRFPKPYPFDLRWIDIHLTEDGDLVVRGSNRISISPFAANTVHLILED